MSAKFENKIQVFCHSSAIITFLCSELLPGARVMQSQVEVLPGSEELAQEATELQQLLRSSVYQSQRAWSAL